MTFNKAKFGIGGYQKGTELIIFILSSKYATKDIMILCIFDSLECFSWRRIYHVLSTIFWLTVFFINVRGLIFAYLADYLYFKNQDEFCENKLL